MRSKETRGMGRSTIDKNGIYDAYELENITSETLRDSGDTDSETIKEIDSTQKKTYRQKC